MKRVMISCIIVAGAFCIAFIIWRFIAPKKIHTFDAPTASFAPSASQTFDLIIVIKKDSVLEIGGTSMNVEDAARIISEKKWDEDMALKITHDPSLPYPSSTVVSLLEVCRKYGVSQITVE